MSGDDGGLWRTIPVMPEATKTKPLTEAERIQDVLDDIVPFALTLADVEESTSYGQPAMKRSGHLLFGLRGDSGTLSFCCGFEARAVLMKEHPKMFFITDHYLNYPACIVSLANADKKVLRRAVEDAWKKLGELKPRKPSPKRAPAQAEAKARGRRARANASDR